MARIHAFELHELPGCPAVLRNLATDYLRTIAALFRVFEPMAPLLASAVRASRDHGIVDLCSGGSGPVVGLAEAIASDLGSAPAVTLTDLYPNRTAFEWAAAQAKVPVQFEPEPVDARNVPQRLAGARTLFDAFHHFRPDDARGILADAARKGTPLLVVEGTERSLPAIVGMLLFVPLLVLITMPLVRPFNIWRLVLTYLVPVAVPLILFDGIVSCLRSYTPAELRELCRGLESPEYAFEVGIKKSRGQRLTYLLGTPRGPRLG